MPIRRLIRRLPCALLALALLRSAAAQTAKPAATPVGPGVTEETLLGAQANTDVWALYGRDYSSTRFFPGNQINRETVKRLAPRWIHQTGILGGGFETTAITFEGKIYITTPNSHLICLDLETGAKVWQYDHVMPAGINLCCGPVNRGVAVRGRKIYFGTLDAHLICLNADTGLVLWDRTVADYRDAYSITSAPIALKNMILIGNSGAEFGARGFLDAYNPDTGELIWRFYGTAGPEDPGHSTWEGDSWMQGGGTAWIPGSYDPELNILYWGFGNPSPDFYGDPREGDNLYTDSMVALNPETGKMIWYFQFTPHDVFDWAGNAEPILVDLEINGAKTKALIQANRNGYLYALDRTNGKLLYAKPYSEGVNWANIDANGKPVIKPEIVAEKVKTVYPGIFGGKNWPPAAYSPKTQMIYIPDQKRATSFTPIPTEYRKGLPYYGGIPMFTMDTEASGFVKAVDARTGEIKWKIEVHAPNWAGMLATGGGLVFGGAPDGNLRAFNDETGEVLWEFQTGSGVFAPPISFTFKGKQYIGLASGWGQPNELVGFGPPASRGCAYYIFGLVE